MLRNLKRNKKGIVFVTVLMIIIVLMILAISVISLNVSQVLVTENEVRRLQAEVIALGALAKIYGYKLSNGSANFLTNFDTLNNRLFTITSNIVLTNLNINVVY